jgi:hypothetical protein
VLGLAKDVFFLLPCFFLSFSLLGENKVGTRQGSPS